MVDLDRRAFRLGYRDFLIYDEQRRLGIARLFDSRYALPWRPPEGHEEAYRAGWETARHRHHQGEETHHQERTVA